MTINGIRLNAVNFDPEKPYIARGGSAIFEYIFDIENGTMEQLAEHEAFAELAFKPTGMVSVDGTDLFVLETNEKTATGKKTVKLAAMYGKKTIATASAVITVTSKLVEGFENVGMEPVFDDEGNIVSNVFSFIFRDPEKYCKLTIASSDASVVKFGKITYPTAAEIAEAKEQGTPITIVTPYTEGKPGSALVTVTLADEIKSTYKFSHTVLDKEPKVIETTFTINTAYDLKKAPITIHFPNEVLPIEDLTIVNGTKGFGLEVAEYSQPEKKMTGYITLPENTTLKAGTYTVALKAIVGRDDLGTFEFKIPLKVKVVTTKPSVTIKQTKKVNTFFDQSEGGQYYQPNGFGLMTFTGKTDVITNVSMVADDFEMYEVDGNYLRLIYDAETQNFTLKRRQDDSLYVRINEINKTGKSWNVNERKVQRSGR